MKIVSPITLNDNVELYKKYSSSELVNNYRNFFGIDVDYLFNENEEFSLYECKDTGYYFFHPLNLSGDGKFYEALQKFEWYYMPWKWEHQKTANLVKEGMKVLEVGCAEGDFIEKIENDFKGICQGLELNENAQKNALKKGLKVELQTIQDFSKINEESFDLVCSFQVLEHISDVHSFIEGMVKCLKKGGKLVVGVPNNDSFYGMSESILNLPPHHMGLWNKQSLSAICEIFNLQVSDFYFEPTQVYHKDLHFQIENKLKFKKMDQNIARYGFFGRILNQVYKLNYKSRIKKMYPTFDNFTILGVFTKK